MTGRLTSKKCIDGQKHVVDQYKFNTKQLGHRGPKGDKYIGLEFYCERCKQHYRPVFENPEYKPHKDAA